MERHSAQREESVGIAWQQVGSSIWAVPAPALALVMTCSSTSKTTYQRGLILHKGRLAMVPGPVNLPMDEQLGPRFIGARLIVASLILVATFASRCNVAHRLIN
jgi:hypothetical protein